MMFELLGAAALLVAGVLFLSIGTALLFDFIRRAPWRRNQRQVSRSRSCGTAGLEAAVVAFTLFYKPSLELAVETAQVEQVDEDDDGDPDSPAKQLQRQLKRIRHGEHVETLVVRLQPRNRSPS